MKNETLTDYDVIGPRDSFAKIGRTYQDLMEAYAQWLLSDSPDDHNNGDVVFLRGVDFPETPERLGYNGQPVMKVGNRALNIYDGQYLFRPVICTIMNDIDDGKKTVQDRYFSVWRDTLQGDNPPSTSQIRIDGEKISLGGPTDLSDFLTYSRDFTLHVPTVPYGRSLKDYLDTPITPGRSQAVIGGYCILFKFKSHRKPESHTILFEGRGVQGPQGQYVSSGLYQVNVSPSPPKPTSRDPESRLVLSPDVTTKMIGILKKRELARDLEDGDSRRLQEIVKKAAGIV
jgi:hypothetical protein